MDTLLPLITHPLTDADKALIQTAYDFAYAKHDGQLRNSGEPYFIHVLAVAQNCAKLGMDLETYCGQIPFYEMYIYIISCHGHSLTIRVTIIKDVGHPFYRNTPNTPIRKNTDIKILFAETY